MKTLKLSLIVSTGTAILCICAGCSKSNGNSNAPAAKAGAAAPVDSTAGTDDVQATPAGPVEMKVKWQVGKEYAQELSMNQTGHLQVPGVAQPVEQHLTMVQDFTISALRQMPDGATELELKFTGLKLSNQAGEQVVMDFDSARDPKVDADNPAAPMFRKMIGAHVKYQLDASGQSIKVEGMDEFLAQMTGGDPQSAPVVKSMINEDTIKQLAMRGQGLPGKPVKVGDQWPVNLDVKAGPVGTLQMKMNSTFKGWQQHEGAKCALVTFTGEIAVKPHDNSGTTDISLENGKLNGNMWYDPAINMVMETDSEQNMNMKISTQGKVINSEMQQNIVVKITKITDIPK